MQTGDTSPYATSIASVLQKWGSALFAGLVMTDADTGEDDDAAFDHICSKLVSRFVPYLIGNGILKCGPTALAVIAPLRCWLTPGRGRLHDACA